MKKELAVTSSVQPKPTKAEIIDALTQLEVQRRDDRSKADVARRGELDKEIQTELLEHLKKSASKSEGEVRWSVYTSGKVWATASFEIADIPKSVKAKMVEADNLPSMARQHRFCDVRKDIVAASTGFDKSTRVSRLLKNDESRESLEKLLDTLSK